MPAKRNFVDFFSGQHSDVKCTGCSNKQPTSNNNNNNKTNNNNQKKRKKKKRKKRKKKKERKKEKEKGKVNEIYILYTQTGTVLPIVLYYSSLVSLPALMFTAAHRGAVKCKHSV